MSKQITIQDDTWDQEVQVLSDRLVEMIEQKYPTIYEVAKKRCEAGLMANPPCRGCVVATAAQYGLRVAL